MNDGKGTKTQCPVCGKTFTRKTKGQTYCSRACVGKLRCHKKQPPRPKGNCANCGKSLDGIKGRRTFCCDACAKANEGAKNKQKGPYAIICERCGREFQSRTRGRHYCSEECRNQVQVEKAKASMQKKQEETGNGPERICVRIRKRIPVFQELQPQIGGIYECLRCKGQGGVTLIIPGIGKYGLIVLEEEVAILKVP